MFEDIADKALVDASSVDSIAVSTAVTRTTLPYVNQRASINRKTNWTPQCMPFVFQGVAHFVITEDEACGNKLLNCISIILWDSVGALSQKSHVGVCGGWVLSMFCSLVWCGSDGWVCCRIPFHYDNPFSRNFRRLHCVCRGLTALMRRYIFIVPLQKTVALDINSEQNVTLIDLSVTQYNFRNSKFLYN